MSTELYLPQPGEIDFRSVEERPLQAGEVRLRTLYSGISAGTELSLYRGTNPYTRKQWDSRSRLFLPAANPSQTYPLGGFGYEEVGEVVEVGPGVDAPREGDIVYGIWGHRSTAVLPAERAASRILPDGLDPVLGIFSHIGPVALNGIHDAGILIGETAAVFGLGVPGQIAAQLARRSGARVIGVDLFDERLELAHRLGAIDTALNPQQGSPAEAIKALTGGLGADVVIEVTGNAAALNEAIRAAAFNSRVVSLGFFQGEARGLYLGEEFHHNRVQLICSQISASPAHISHRWNRERLVQTVMRLQADGELNLRPLITHVIPFRQAAEAYRLLAEGRGDVLQVVLDFSEAEK